MQEKNWYFSHHYFEFIFLSINSIFIIASNQRNVGENRSIRSNYHQTKASVVTSKRAVIVAAHLDDSEDMVCSPFRRHSSTVLSLILF